MRSNVHVEIDPPRRRLLMISAAVPLVAFFARARAASPSPAAAPAIPRPLLDLDSAAMALFDAAEATRWDDAHNALAKVEGSAGAIAALEARYTEAGGNLERFFEATNHLSADLIDARAAESVRDRAWLLASADNILERAGDLTEPFARRTDAALPRIEVLLVLARRMRRALDWQDVPGFEAALRDFNRLWPIVRSQVAARMPGQVQAVDQALVPIAQSRTVDNLRALSTAVHKLGEMPAA
jgi:hypothetical protein